MEKLQSVKGFVQTVRTKSILIRRKIASTKFAIGFTLIELLIVIGIIGILATIIIVALGSSRARADDSRRSASLRNIQTQVVDTTNVGQTSYTSAFTAGPVADKLQLLATISNVAPSQYDVRTDQNSYVVVFPLRTSGYWCIDSANSNKKVDGRLNATGPNSCDNIATGAPGNIPPVITLSTLSPAPTIACAVGGTTNFSEPSYTATDTEDGNVMLFVQHSDQDISPTITRRTYTVTDTGGLTTTATRDMTHPSSCGGGGGGANTPPVITLGPGPTPLCTSRPTNWTEPSFTVSDAEETIPLGQVTYMDAFTDGHWVRTYTVTDSGGLTDTKTRMFGPCPAP